MKGLQEPAYLYGFILFNVLALLFLLCAVKWPRIGRLLFFLLFSWASWMNFSYARNNPTAYLEYGELTFSGLYRDFIQGWFSRHIALMVGLIAFAQALIAISLLLKGRVYKLGCIGGMIFLVAISPLGVGSGFPCTLVFAGGLLVLFKKGNFYLWRKLSRRPALW